MKTQVSISLARSRLNEVDILAKKKQMSRSQFLRIIVIEYLKSLSSEIKTKELMIQDMDYQIEEKKAELKSLMYHRDIIKDQKDES
tara:strand:- start:7656 stop:7913 length:258 start_codon:yes stop_codon:yes gene_type:complete